MAPPLPRTRMGAVGGRVGLRRQRGRQRLGNLASYRPSQNERFPRLRRDLHRTWPVFGIFRRSAPGNCRLGKALATLLELAPSDAELVNQLELAPERLPGD